MGIFSSPFDWLHGEALRTSVSGPGSSESVFASSQAAEGRDYQVKDRKLPIYCVQTEKPQVALSFDAAWGNEDTRQLMEILAKHNVKVTFFMTGGWVEKYPEDVKYIASQGHDLGNHSENHKNMSQLGEEEIRIGNSNGSRPREGADRTGYGVISPALRRL